MKKLFVMALIGLATVSANAGTYRIQYGDTLISIANKHGITYSELIKANKGLDPDYIKAGFNIRIPETAKPVKEEYVHPASRRSKPKSGSSFTNPTRPKNESSFYTPTGRTKVVVTEYVDYSYEKDTY